MRVSFSGEPDSGRNAELPLSGGGMNDRSASGSGQANLEGNPAGCEGDLLLSIRRILSEVNARPDDQIRIDVPEIPGTGSRVYRRFRDDENGAELTRRLGWLATRAAASRSDAESFDTTRLRRSHEKRVKRIQRARARRKSRGLVSTGLTLVSMVAATLAGIYLLHPQIIAASPRLAPAIQQYVETIDRYRAEGGQETAELRDWLADRLGKPAAAEG